MWSEGIIGKGVEMKNRFRVVLIANDEHPIPDWLSRKFIEADIDYIYHQCYNRDESNGNDFT